MILIVGATGQLGSAITRRLLARGDKVRVLVRAGSAYQALESAGAEIAIGDLKIPDTLARACSGVERVLTTATSVSRGGDDTIAAVDLQGIADLIETADAAGVNQFVFTSAYGLRDLPNVPFALAKIASEARLMLCGMDYTILQPSAFMEPWIGVYVGAQVEERGLVSVFGDGNRRISFVAQDDVADLAVAVLGHPKAVRVVIPFAGGPAVSYREIVADVERVTGRSVPVHTVTPGTIIPGLPPVMSQIAEQMIAGGHSILDTSHVAKTFSLSPRTPKNFVELYFKPSAPAAGAAPAVAAQ